MNTKYNFDYDFEKQERKKKIAGFFLGVFRWGVEIAAVILLAYILVAYTVEQTDVLDNSMEITLSEGDTIIINKLAFRKNEHTHYYSDFHHVLLLNKSGRVGNSVRRCTDRQNH